MISWKITFIIGVILIIGINSFFYLSESLVSTPTEVEYFWDFGDGTTSSEYNPEHTFEDAGQYKVRVYIKNGTTTTKKTFVVDATQGMKYQAEVIPITIEGFSTPE